MLINTFVRYLVAKKFTSLRKSSPLPMVAVVTKNCFGLRCRPLLIPALVKKLSKWSTWQKWSDIKCVINRQVYNQQDSFQSLTNAALGFGAAFSDVGLECVCFGCLPNFCEFFWKCSHKNIHCKNEPRLQELRLDFSDIPKWLKSLQHKK